MSRSGATRREAGRPVPTRPAGGTCSTEGVRLSVADVGRRVVVRHRLADGRATDVVGELLAVDERGVRVRAADGGGVAVEARAVVAARVVGPARTRARAVVRPVEPAPTPSTPVTGGQDTAPVTSGHLGDVLATSVDDAARITAPGWAARHEEALGDWLLRSGSPRMRRGASALAVGDPGLPLDDALAAVADHYRGLGLEPAVQVSAPAAGSSARDGGTDAEGLERALAAGGWLPQPWTVLAVRPAVHLEGRARTAAVELSPSPGRAWLGASDHRGSPLARTDLPPERDGVAVAYAGVPAPGGTAADGALASEPAPLVAVARGALAQRWLGITCVVVDPAHRRRGLAGALLDALVDHLGGPAAADALYVQVVGHNVVARAAWCALGFADHSRYRFWTLPDPG